ncbi:C2 domain protein [Gregarina niphandrodes]|uniref:C2 domain protein n=1 Tax=Gregarina niphandrodes TaxID=110365 RepID=A0A023B071_GRENI|nr:C2 domain protein [Gregarina niphandrodes]EZG44373.1 C2 domain protein [Gregarina niphandrodes]|eukprot:XP_011132688.1 C2 domain protein [Gregarina niphandrodes]
MATYDVVVTLHGVHQLVWPGEASGAEVGVEEATVFARLAYSAVAAGTSTLPNPVVRVSVCGLQRETAVKRQCQTAIFEKTFEWHQINDKISVESATAAVEEENRLLPTRLLGAILGSTGPLPAPSDLAPADPHAAQEASLLIEVHHSGYFGYELIGSFERSLKSINGLSGHSISRIKVPISHPTRPNIPRGWITFSATCVAEGESVLPNAQTVHGAELMQNMEFRTISREIQIYRGRAIRSYDGGRTPSTFIVIKQSSTIAYFPVKRQTSTPVWNQAIAVTAQIPSAEDYLIIELWEQQGNNIKRCLAKETLPIAFFEDYLTSRWIHFYRREGNLQATATGTGTGGLLRVLSQVSKELSIDEGDSSSSSSDAVPSPKEGSPVSSPKAQEGDIEEQRNPAILDYMGRVLIGTRLEAHNQGYLDPQTLAPRSVPKADPPETMYQLWMDFYSLNVSGDVLVKSIARSNILEVSVGEWSWQTVLEGVNENPHPLNIRMPSTELRLPPLKQAPHLIIRIMPQEQGYNPPAPASSGAILAPVAGPVCCNVWSVGDLMKVEAVPIWSRFAVPSSASKCNLQMLYSVSLKSMDNTAGRSDSATAIPRPPRITYQVRKFVICMRLLQAVNVPSSKRDSFPTSSLTADFEGITVQTAYVAEDPNPEFNFDYVAELYLPTRVELTAPICISLHTTNDVVGRVLIPASYLQHMALELPEWFILDTAPASPSPTGSVAQPALQLGTSAPMCLFAFELFEGIDPVKLAKSLPPMKQCTIPVQLTVLGVRFFPFAKFRNTLPLINVTCGRTDEEWMLNENLVGWGNKTTGSRCVDLMKSMAFNLYTNPTGIYVDMLRFELWQSDDELEGRASAVATQSSKVTGVGCVPLQLHMPWLPNSFKQLVANAFRPSSAELEQIGLKPATLEDFAAVAPFQRHAFTNTTAKHKVVGIDFPTTADAAPNLNDDALNRSVCVRRSLEDCLTNDETVDPDDEELNKVLEILESNSDLDPELRPQEKPNRSSEILAVDETPVRPKREGVLPCVLEHELDPEVLPWVVVPLMGRYSNSRGNLLGLAKIALTLGKRPVAGLLAESELPRELVEDLQKRHIEKVNFWTYQALYREPFVLRVHVYSAAGLTRKHPKQAMVDLPPAWTLLVRLADHQQTEAECLRAMGPTAVDIDGTVTAGRQHVWEPANQVVGLPPEFYASYELAGFFPINAILQITVMEHLTEIPQSGLEDRVTIAAESFMHAWLHVDLEDRWHSRDWQRYRLDAPVETGSLFRAAVKQDSDALGTCCGKLNFSLTMLRPSEARDTPFIPLVRPKAPNVEVRIALFDLLGLKLPNNEQRSLFVRVTLHDESYDSDVHYRSTDGTAQFNWRFVFSPTSNKNSSILIFQVWSSNILARNELLAERELDLTGDIAAMGSAARKDLNDLKFTLKAPTTQNDCGALTCQITLIESELAEANPVGQGRNERNCDPYLPPVSKNRNMIELDTGILDVAFNAGRVIKKSTRYFTFGIVAIVVLFILSTIKNLFK